MFCHRTGRERDITAAVFLLLPFHITLFPRELLKGAEEGHKVIRGGRQTDRPTDAIDGEIEITIGRRYGREGEERGARARERASERAVMMVDLVLVCLP